MKIHITEESVRNINKNDDNINLLLSMIKDGNIPGLNLNQNKANEFVKALDNIRDATNEAFGKKRMKEQYYNKPRA